jgi:hypothetical protein
VTKFQRGDLVAYLYDTGGFGHQTLYGVVEKAGSKSYTVRWESGIRNRRPQNDHLVRGVHSDELDTAREAMVKS